MHNRTLLVVVSCTVLATACGRTDTDEAHLSAAVEVAPAFDPGLMTEPPSLAEVTGTDAVSRAKAEEVYFRCSKVPRPERSGNAWCQLRDKIL